MLFQSNTPLRQIFTGNILMVGCIVFYLLWWILAFRPVTGIRGFKTGWLLIPAFIQGLISVMLICSGSGGARHAALSFFPPGAIIIASVASYIALLIVTGLLFHRVVTTELFLIVGWTGLIFTEVNALYGLNSLTRHIAIFLFILAIIMATLSLICYILYYGLDEKSGYIDGMIPLLLVGAYMVLLEIFIST